MRKPHKDVPFDSNAFRDFTHELEQLEKLKHSRPHYPEKFWFRALAEADRKHVARTLETCYFARDAQEYRPPTVTFHEKLYCDTSAKMNGNPLMLATA